MILLLILALWDPTLSGALPDPVLSSGCDAVADNPALLGLDSAPPASFRFLGFGAGGQSDALTLPFLYRIATTPVHLDSAAKQGLLERMADRSGSILTGTELKVVHFQAWHFGGGVTLQDRVRTTIPRDVAELVFFGNELGRTYLLDGIGQDTLQVLRVAGAAGFPILTAERLKVHAGISASWLRGFGYAEVLHSAGWLLTTDRYASLSYERQTRRASGGDGVALGYGIAIELDSQWRAAAALADAPGVIWWSRGCFRRDYAVAGDSISVLRLLQLGSLDSVLLARDTTQPTAGFATALSPRFSLGVGFVGSDVVRAGLVAAAGGGSAGVEVPGSFAAARVMLRVLRTAAVGADVGWRSGAGPFGQVALGGRFHGLTAALTLGASLGTSAAVNDASAGLSLGYTY